MIIDTWLLGRRLFIIVSFRGSYHDSFDEEYCIGVLMVSKLLCISFNREDIAQTIDSTQFFRVERGQYNAGEVDKEMNMLIFLGCLLGYIKEVI